MNEIIKQEHEHYFLGLKSRAANVVADSETGRIRNQKIVLAGHFREDGVTKRISVKLRFDDEHNNGHESFAITADIYRKNRLESCGCQHDEIVKHFPTLEPLIKWHLTSTNGPMYYIANTVYHVQQGNLNYARSTAVWPEATDEQLLLPRIGLESMLKDRLPALLVEFKDAMLECGFVWPKTSSNEVTNNNEVVK